MDQDVKDILVDGDALPDVSDAITKATAALKQQLAQKENEAKQLKEQYDRVARMADERGQEATKAQADLHGMTQYTARAEQAAIANALAAAEAEAKSMQADLAQAIETADGKRAAELQVKLGELTARKHTLEQGKDRIEEEIARAKDAPAPQPRQPAVFEADPYEAAISKLPDNQKQWLRKHKDKGYFDPSKPPAEQLSHKLLSAYHGAVAAGLAENGPAFTVYLDRVLGHTAPPKPQQQAPQEAGDASERFQEAPPAQAPASPPAAKRAIPAAPPSRAQGGGGAGGGGKNYQLTREQHHTAQRLGMTPAEYIQGLQEGIKRGKLQPHVLQAR